MEALETVFSLIDVYYIGTVNVTAYGVFKIFKNFKYVNENKSFVVLFLATFIGVIFGYVDWTAKETESFATAFRKGFFSYTVAIFLYDIIIKQFERLIGKMK